MKLMTRGKTVAQIFGLAGEKPIRYKLDRLWLEIPLKKEVARFFNSYPNGNILLGDGTVIKQCTTTYAGRVYDTDMAMPFKALFWTGSDDAGLGFYAENDRNWQSESQERVIELLHGGDSLILRVHLLDCHPESWTAAYEEGNYAYAPLTFRFGLQSTPVKPFPKQPYLHNALHLDCFVKIKGNYRDFLTAESEGRNRFDLLKEKRRDHSDSARKVEQITELYRIVGIHYGADQADCT